MSALSRVLFRACILVAVLAGVNEDAIAAGLGRINVLSALGEPFRAEISVVADKNEVDSLAARMASPAAFQSAGLVYSSAIPGMRVSVEKRAGGEPYVSVASNEPLNEPVLDLLVELSWSSGRIAREFTAFVDPRSLIAEREKQRAAAPVTAAAPPTPAPKPEPLPEPAAQPEAAAATPAAPPTAPTAETAPTQPPEQAAAKSAAQPPAKPVQMIGGTAPTLLSGEVEEEEGARPASAGETYGPVKHGDTLSKIAKANKPAELTLEQMLVLLFRNNPGAFAGKNMNRLKAGKILRLPEPADYGSVAPAAAKREVQLQAANWKTYRERLASAAAAQQPAAETAPPQQAAAGQITPKVEEKPTPAGQPKEVLKLSKGEAAKPGTGVAAGTGTDRAKALEEDLAAREKALKESNDRVARLEKTVKDLQALLEVKNQGMAELQRQATGAQPAKPAAPASPAQPPSQPQAAAAAKPAATPTPPKPAEPTIAAKPPATAEAPAAPPAMQATAPAAQKPSVPVQPVSPASSAPQGAPKTAPAPTAPVQQPRKPVPPPPPPSLLDQVMNQPLYVGAAVLVLVLIGTLATRAIRRRREAKVESEEVAPAIFAGGTPGSKAFAPGETDVGLAATKNRDIAEEVDPLEEAEIFLAYGRDAQAEELLKEALSAHPRRHEIHVKLLEIYAKRKDIQAFESVARELQQATGGKGEHWDRALRLGYQLDPENPRYAAGKPSGEEASARTEEAEAERLDFEVGLSEEAASTTATDIDLGETSQLDRTQIINPVLPEAAGQAAAQNVDFDVELPRITEPAAAEPERAESNAIDFDFELNKLAPAAETAPAAATAARGGDAGLDFDIGSLSLDTASGKTEPTLAASTPKIDLSSISLDLDGTPTSPTASAAGKDERWYEVQTKFDLAKAYQEMGDKDGAREILKEVIVEGDAEQKAAAEAVLATLG